MGTSMGAMYLKAVYRANNLYLSMNNSIGSFSPPLAGGRVIRLNVSGWPSTPTVDFDKTFGVASINDPPGATFHYGWPGIEVNSAGSMAITTVRTSASIFPEVRISGWLVGETDMRSSILAKGGEGPYNSGVNPARYSETVGTAVDPDDVGIWYAHEYPTSQAGTLNWSMWVGKLYGQKGVVRGAGDLTGDRRSDIALVGGSGWTTVPIARSIDLGGFFVTVENTLSSFPGWAHQSGAKPVSGDFNGDGRGDIALTGANWTSIPIAFSNGYQGSFQDPPRATNRLIST
jgi:hypothetical protein